MPNTKIKLKLKPTTKQFNANGLTQYQEILDKGFSDVAMIDTRIVQFVKLLKIHNHNNKIESTSVEPTIGFVQKNNITTMDIQSDLIFSHHHMFSEKIEFNDMVSSTKSPETNLDFSRINRIEIKKLGNKKVYNNLPKGVRVVAGY